VEAGDAGRAFLHITRARAAPATEPVITPGEAVPSTTSARHVLPADV